MKKFFVSIIMSVIFFTVNAQLSVGPRAGVNISMAKFSASDVVVDPIVPAFYGGAFANYQFAKNFAAEVELFYSGEGTKYKIKGSPTVYTANFGYFNVPLLVQFKAKGGFFLETGPQMGFLLSANETDNGSTESIKDDISSSKFSWCFGLGKQFSKKLGLDLRYAAGFSNINKISVSGGNIKDNVLSLGLSYSFHVGK
ncbi:MAG: porin family protein [Ginsengibacter sp.]